MSVAVAQSVNFLTIVNTEQGCQPRAATAPVLTLLHIDRQPCSVTHVTVPVNMQDKQKQTISTDVVAFTNVNIKYIVP